MAEDDEDMRRTNKNKARKTHLDLPSNDDGVGAAKVHKKGASKSQLAMTILCGLAALGTLFYVNSMVFSTGKDAGSAGGSLPHKARFMEQQNRMLPPDSIYRAKVQDIHDNWQELMKYSGSVSLVVNVACE